MKRARLPNHRTAFIARTRRGPAPWLALLAALITVVLWASAFVGIRTAGRYLSPGSLALGRLAVGSIVLGCFVFVRGWSPPSRRDMPLLLLVGLSWFGLYNVVLNRAEQLVDAGTAAMLVNVGPILIVAFAAIFLGERITRNLLLGGGIAFVGVLTIGIATSSGNASFLGIILCLAAALGYAVGVVAQKPLLGRLPALEVTWLCCTIGAFSVLPFAPTLVHDVGEAPGSAITWMIYLGAFPTAVAFTTWAYALARTTAGRVAATTYLVPPVAIGISWILLGETPNPLALLGGAVSLSGVYIARRVPPSLHPVVTPLEEVPVRRRLG